MTARKKLLTYAALLAIASFAVALIGPFATYSKLVSSMSTMIPKPEGVPQRAYANANPEGGLFWIWEDNYDDGTVTWTSDDHHSVHLSVCIELCSNPIGSVERRALTLNYRTDTGKLELLRFGAWGYPTPCERTATKVEMQQFLQLIDTATAYAKSKVELELLEHVTARLDELDQNCSLHG